VEQVLHSAGVLAAVDVSLLEKLLDLLAGVGALGGVLHNAGVDNALDVDVRDGVASGHDVVVVDELDKRLDARPEGEKKQHTSQQFEPSGSCLMCENSEDANAPLQDLLLGHGLGHGEGVLVNAGNKAVTEVALLVTFIEGLDHDGFTAGVSSLENDNNLAGLDEFAHFCFLQERKPQGLTKVPAGRKESAANETNRGLFISHLLTTKNYAIDTRCEEIDSV